LRALTPPQVDRRDPSLSVEQKRSLIQRIANSERFQKAPRLRDFLVYSAECTLEKRFLEVREQVIAEKVFNRGSNHFQGAQDTIVRAEARNLRKRLETYFEIEGKEEAVIVSMPKGGYSLAFEPRPHPRFGAFLEEPEIQAHVGLAQPKAATPAVQVPSGGDRPTSLRIYQTCCIALGLIASVASAIAWSTWSSEHRLQQKLGISSPAFPFSALFSANPETMIVTSDTGLLQISSLAHRRITLDEYMARSYPEVRNIEPPYLIRNWNIWEFTDGREMAIAGLILRGNAQFASRIWLRSGHEVQLQDFKDKSAIIIGSSISNPWAQLYEDQLNFRCELGDNNQIHFNDASSADHYPNDDDNRHSRTYARIAFLPRSADTSPALLIAGTTAQSTQAAGELVTNQDRLDPLLRKIGLDPKGSPRFFEILIRSSNFVSGAILPELVSWRTKPAHA
jgi:hypothetical protein